MALAQRRAYVAQTSFAETGHFCDTLDGALGFSGPALVRIHTPSPSRHGFPSRRTLQQARLAIRCRAFPLFRYDPEGEGVFGAGSRLKGELVTHPRLVVLSEISTVNKDRLYELLIPRINSRDKPLTGTNRKSTS